MSSLAAELDALGIIVSSRLEPFYPRVRDRADIGVLRDPVTEVIVLSSTQHASVRYYESKAERLGYEVHGDRVVTPRLEDNIRRADTFGALLRNKHWLDFGCGLGGMLDEMKGQAAWAAGLEPSRERAAVVAGNGHFVVSGLDEVADGSLDIVTLFHVLEHLDDSLQTLIRVREKLKPGARVLIEVPHARDALFTLYDSDAFKRFTFWSEHLVLHTRQSLTRLLDCAGFDRIEVSGCQRYPLSNHLHWLVRQAPGGHEAWPFLNGAGLHAEYEAALSRVDRTDTLIVHAQAPCEGAFVKRDAP